MQNDPSDKETAQQDILCPICLQIYYKPVSLHPCKHLFCDTCLQQTILIGNDQRCPLCRVQYTPKNIKLEKQLWEVIKSTHKQDVQKREKMMKRLEKERILIQLDIGNTTEELQTTKKNKYQWQLYVISVQGQQPLHKLADLVQIQLDETFPNPIQKIIPKANKPITLSRIGWGTFRIGVKVYWKKCFNEKMTEFYHDLEFVPLKENRVHAYLTMKKQNKIKKK